LGPRNRQFFIFQFGISMNHKQAPGPLGAVNIPPAWHDALAAQLSHDENVCALLEVDLDAQMRFVPSVLVATDQGEPLSGRELVRSLWRQGLAVSSGSACSSVAAGGKAAAGGTVGPVGSAVLRAMGFSEAVAASGLRISLGPWLGPESLERVPEALDRARRELGRRLIDR
jgi:cysteine sulfinate desulfinase/cysteine desulfurase-like protein